MTDSDRSALADWFGHHRRDLPWRQSKDPWHIWLSEVILQQTRVDQGLPYFERFVERFPTVADMAAAELDDVLRLWEGLGYYSRGRNLYRASRYVIEERAGKMPTTFSEWLEMPGIGPYTAAAISSIAQGLPHAVVDGNVIRVLARLHGFSEPVDSNASKKTLQTWADAFLNRDSPGDHNEAMMELGALVCAPRAPKCDSCPLSDTCIAFREGRQESLPVKRKKKPVPHYDIAVGIIRNEDAQLYIQQRDTDAMLGGLWEFPGGKVEHGESPAEACRREVMEETGLDVIPVEQIATIKHAYSHFRITMHAFECALNGTGKSSSSQPHAWIAREEFGDYAFPRANRRLLELLSQEPD